MGCTSNKGIIDSSRPAKNEKTMPVKEPQLSLEDLKLNVNIVKDWKEERVIGGSHTHLAFKNENNYLIGTDGEGLKLILNDTPLFSGGLPEDGSVLLDIAYIPPLDFYLLASDEKIFRKDIDDKPAYPFMSIECGYRNGACLRYSSLNQRLIVPKGGNSISVINIETKEVEIEVVKAVGNEIQDFRVFGEQEDKVISVTQDGHILLYALDYAQKQGSVIAQHQVTLSDERNEAALGVAVCGKNDYALVELVQNHPATISSRLMVFKVSGDTLVQTASIDQYSQKIKYNWALESFGYSGSHSLWVGLSRDYKEPAKLYSFSTEAAELKELEDKRVSTQETHPEKLHRLGRKLYYTGYEGQLVSLALGN